MSSECGNCKANPVDILTALQGVGISDKAKLVAVLEASGVTDRDTLEMILECRPSTLREARSALKIQRQKSSAVDASARNPAPEIQRSAGNPAVAPEIQRQKSSDRQNSSVGTGFAIAHANNELPSEVSSYLEVNTPPPPSVELQAPRVGEEDFGFGVMVNCKTIRHPNFSISIDGVRMTTLASGLDADQVKSFCVGMALQWAGEIDSGKPASDVLPQRIPNFLSASIMNGKVRADVGAIKRSKASAMPERKRLDLSKIETYDCEPV